MTEEGTPTMFNAEINWAQYDLLSAFPNNPTCTSAEKLRPSKTPPPR